MFPFKLSIRNSIRPGQSIFGRGAEPLAPGMDGADTELVVAGRAEHILADTGTRAGQEHGVVTVRANAVEQEGTFRLDQFTVLNSQCRHVFGGGLTSQIRKAGAPLSSLTLELVKARPRLLNSLLRAW